MTAPAFGLSEMSRGACGKDMMRKKRRGVAARGRGEGERWQKNSPLERNQQCQLGPGEHDAVETDKHTYGLLTE